LSTDIQVCQERYSIINLKAKALDEGGVPGETVDNEKNPEETLEIRQNRRIRPF